VNVPKQVSTSPYEDLINNFRSDFEDVLFLENYLPKSNKISANLFKPLGVNDNIDVEEGR
jgi:hypothetical protein